MSAIFSIDFFNINCMFVYKMLHFDPNRAHLNWMSGCRDMKNSLKFVNNVKHKNLSPLLA